VSLCRESVSIKNLSSCLGIKELPNANFKSSDWLSILAASFLPLLKKCALATTTS
jgi:hypothetical protein